VKLHAKACAVVSCATLAYHFCIALPLEFKRHHYSLMY